jgi:hypothetical protein
MTSSLPKFRIQQQTADHNRMLDHRMRQHHDQQLCYVLERELGKSRREKLEDDRVL